VSLIQSLPEGPLDIVGDIHGESDALYALLTHLGYDDDGNHPQRRTLVFVGDYVDRGPDSPAVVAQVRRLVENGHAKAILGNHEINLLREDAKDGSGWFFDERIARDNPKYSPFVRPDETTRRQIVDFLGTLPIALERADLRVVHAAWQEPQVQAVRCLPAGSVREQYDAWEREALRHGLETGLDQRMAAELQAWVHGLEDADHAPPFLQAHAEHESNRQMLNPLRVLTSGVEREGGLPFYSGGKWRFAQRVPWWDEYDHPTPVVVGHYWRRVNQIDRSLAGKRDEDLFGALAPNVWHGRRCNVFCVDFSAGGRWVERKAGLTPGHDFKLAALRWPERELMFDDGEVVGTVCENPDFSFTP